jgi:hypothetical protein
MDVKNIRVAGGFVGVSCMKYQSFRKRNGWSKGEFVL